MENILDKLNDVQRQAVECTDGPVMVIAGAGSGKTRVLTYRIAHLLSKGVDAFNVLALTFTNKAAKEMKERVICLLGSSEAMNVWMGTFHSIFARILRIEADKLGYPSNFTIYDTDDSKSVIKTILKEQNLDDKMYPVNFVLGRISAAKSNLISVADYNNNAEIQTQDRAAGKPQIGTLYSLYNQRCRKSSAMDFDDLLYNTNVLFRDFTDVLYKYQQKFKYILVDEYQDTNYAQYLIVKKLAANNENICVVGDDAQSIYAFRGANIENILNFKKDYADAKVFKLEQNYRSTKNIVNAANSIIINNKDQIFKEIWTENEEGPKIQLFKTSTDNEEGMSVASSIFENKMNFQLNNSDFAILYRTNAQSRAMEEALRKLNVPYRIFGGLSFYKRKEVKDLIAYFRLTINHNDEEALYRIINYPARGIGKTTLEKIMVVANENDTSIWNIISNLQQFNAALSFNSGTITKISDFVTMIRSYATYLNDKNAFELANHIAASSGILRDLREDKTPEGISRQENIEELLNSIKDLVDKENDSDNEEQNISLNRFMEDIALITDSDKDDKENNDKVSLMTIHAAKGLEFPYVFVVGMEENLFPSQLSLSSRTDLEEERRLFYVAITRAMKKLTLSYSESRYRWGNLTLCEISRFVDEINEKCIDFPQKQINTSSFNYTKKFEPKEKPFVVQQEPPLSIAKKKLTKVSSISNNSNSSADDSFNAVNIGEIAIGMDVEHQRFGKGKVLQLEGNDSNTKALISFNGVGEKQLLLKFAKLKIL
ncbi:MAG: ATP-dependent DNA helicase [Bacteroidetes bacterium CG2_30_32_10]|nr:MAG: ATP-dependent DNA helicase [Bacteroidetes bacterium CG2_30_32_10]